MVSNLKLGSHLGNGVRSVEFHGSHGGIGRKYDHEQTVLIHILNEQTKILPLLVNAMEIGFAD